MKQLLLLFQGECLALFVISFLDRHVGDGYFASDSRVRPQLPRSLHHSLYRGKLCRSHIRHLHIRGFHQNP